MTWIFLQRGYLSKPNKGWLSSSKFFFVLWSLFIYLFIDGHHSEWKVYFKYCIQWFQQFCVFPTFILPWTYCHIVHMEDILNDFIQCASSTFLCLIDSLYTIHIETDLQHPYIPNFFFFHLSTSSFVSFSSISSILICLIIKSGKSPRDLTLSDYSFIVLTFQQWEFCQYLLLHQTKNLIASWKRYSQFVSLHWIIISCKSDIR